MKKKFVIDLTDCYVPLVRILCEETHLFYPKVQISTNPVVDWNVRWTEPTPSPLMVVELLRNHPRRVILRFPSMDIITSKAPFFSVLNRIFHLSNNSLPLFFPRTLSQSDGYIKDKTYIWKPTLGGMGDGILIFDGAHVPECVNPNDGIVQEYVEHPLTLCGKKCDIRVYAMLRSVYPLRVYIHEEAIVRTAAEVYVPPDSSNYRCSFSHLTNYSLNKHKQSDDFDLSTCKVRLLDALSDDSEDENFREVFEKQSVWKQIHDITANLFLSLLPELRLKFRQSGVYPSRCGPRSSPLRQIVGIDILIDEEGHACLLEANNTPSLVADFEVDNVVKRPVIKDFLRSVRDDLRSDMDDDPRSVIGGYQLVDTDTVAEEYTVFSSVCCNDYIVDSFCVSIGTGLVRGKLMGSSAFRRFFTEFFKTEMSSVELDLWFTQLGKHELDIWDIIDMLAQKSFLM